MKYKHVYALLTRRCNLTCPYCDVKDIEDNFDHDKFINELRYLEGTIVLFGGEPTLYRDRLKEIVYDPMIKNKVRSISTNLMVIDDELIQILKDVGGVSTSWNPSRFRNNEYEIWKTNLDIVNGRITLRVLITLTFDLLNMSPSEAISIMGTWNRNTISDITFENLIDEKVDEDYFDRVGSWLCEIFELRKSMDEFFPKIRCNMGDCSPKMFDCSNIYTLNPDGTWQQGCPHTDKLFYVPDKCYSCELAALCRPCRLQKFCSFPKKLYDKLISEHGLSAFD